MLVIQSLRKKILFIEPNPNIYLVKKKMQILMEQL
jgi:hypothetical protein